MHLWCSPPVPAEAKKENGITFMKRILGMPVTSLEPPGIPEIPWARPWDPQGRTWDARGRAWDARARPWDPRGRLWDARARPWDP